MRRVPNKNAPCRPFSCVFYKCFLFYGDWRSYTFYVLCHRCALGHPPPFEVLTSIFTRNVNVHGILFITTLIQRNFHNCCFLIFSLRFVSIISSAVFRHIVRPPLFLQGRNAFWGPNQHHNPPKLLPA